MRLVLYKKIIINIIVLLLVINFFSAYTFSLGAFDLSVNLSLPGKGDTVLSFPPLGSVTANTHYPPLDLRLSLLNINLEQLEMLPSEINREIWSAAMLEKIIREVAVYISVLFILAFFLGIAVFGITSPSFINKKKLLWGGAINVLALSLLFLPMYISYDYKAFSQPQYKGILEAAPWVLTSLEEGPGVINKLGYQLTDAVDNLYLLQEEAEFSMKISEKKANLKVLHISDIHNNPASFDLILRVIDTFQVDMIVDTGDLADYGTALEMEIFSSYFERIDIPYIFVPGNHESPATVEFLKSVKGVNVLEEDVMEIYGLKVAGVADPASYLHAMQVLDEDALDSAAKKLKNLVDNEEGKVDIIAAHNPELFRYVKNRESLLLGGHTHSPYIFKDDNYVEINAGSTGGSGIRGLQNKNVIFSLTLITMHPSHEGSGYLPLSADMIRVESLPFQYSIVRHNLMD